MYLVSKNYKTWLTLLFCSFHNIPLLSRFLRLKYNASNLWAQLRPYFIENIRLWSQRKLLCTLYCKQKEASLLRFSEGHLMHQTLSLCLPLTVRTCTGQANVFVFLQSLQERLCICIWFISILQRFLRQLWKSTKLKDYSPTKTTIVWWMWPLPHPPSLPAKETCLYCSFCSLEGLTSPSSST